MVASAGPEGPFQDGSESAAFQVDSCFWHALPGFFISFSCYLSVFYQCQSYLSPPTVLLSFTSSCNPGSLLIKAAYFQDCGVV